MGLDRGGRLPLLDHQEPAPVRDGCHKIDVPHARLVAGEHDVAGERAEQRFLGARPGVEGGRQHRDLDLGRVGAVGSESFRDRPDRAPSPLAARGTA